MKYKSLTTAFSIMLIALNSSAQVLDKDGNNYKVVKIGTQVWMTQNLNVSHFRNGDTIQEAKTPEEWEYAWENKKPAWCYYKNDPVNGKKYGKLYNWYSVNDPRGLAPKGWHVPSDSEWTTLTTFLGGETVAGTKMKSKSGWNNNGNGTNEIGFEGLPGGYRFFRNFIAGGSTGYWWSSTVDNPDGTAWYRNLNDKNDEISKASIDELVGMSVRCIKD